MSVENRKRLEALVAELKVFILPESKIHKIFVENTKRDLAFVEERLLDDVIEKSSDAFTFTYLKGQRLVLKANVTLFEDTVATLESRIQAMLDEENQTQRNQEKQ